MAALILRLHTQLPAVAIYIVEPAPHVLRTWGFGSYHVTRIFEINFAFLQGAPGLV